MSEKRQTQFPPMDVPIGADDRPGDCPVIVVGIGASTGALKSLKRLFAGMPLGHGAAFVLVQHHEPSREYFGVEQLKDLTELAVVEAEDGMAVLADRIHVMPADKFLNITGSRLTFQEPVYCNGLRMPVDHFFCSLAADQGRRGCAILLNGGGSDGTLGLSEVKATGGKTLMEEPGGTAFSRLPSIEVDAVLPPEAMAGVIVALADQVKGETRNDPSESPEFDADLRAILEILRAKGGHDFRGYKPDTLVRRIRRRMTLAKAVTYGEYVRFLNENPEEAGFLQKDLFIGVTEFFRQKEAWKVLEERVISILVANPPAGSEIRIWVPGCSTGKEVFSLAMLFMEQVERAGKKVEIQIFATDSDGSALAEARNGRYSKEDLGPHVSADRRKRFFEYRDGRYQVIKEIRDKIVFAPQNLTTDPPFSNLDLISCRNLLIYLDQKVQKKIIALFHFALREGGFLFLGGAETVEGREDLFAPVSKKWRIYRRIGVGPRSGIELPVRPACAIRPERPKSSMAALASRMSLASMAQQVLLERFSPACVMIDRKLQVLYVHGAVENYLTFPTGELTTRVVDMAREGLGARLRWTINRCLELNKSVTATARVKRGKKSVPVKTTVSPVRYPREADGLLLVTFEEHRLSAPKAPRRSQEESPVRQLEDELRVTREELQSTIDQLEISNDQLKASNEEVTAANEELRVANEELETSEEELQSMNEELSTINTRLQEKVEELENANNDVLNLLSSTSIATVFLDKTLKIMRYTPAVTRLLSLIPSDVGRPIGDISWRFEDEALLEDAARVLADLTPLAREVRADDGRWYIRRNTPYRTQDDRIEGVVVTFMDVSDLKRTKELKSRLAAIVESSDDAILSKDLDGNILSWNDSAERLFGYRAQEIIGRSIMLLLPDERKAEEEVILGRLKAGERVEHFETVRVAKNGRRIDVSVTVSPVKDRHGRIIAASKIIRDVTERKRAEENLRQSREDLTRAQAVAHTGSWRVDLRRNELRWSEETHRMFGIPHGTPLTYEAFLATVHPDDRAHVEKKWKAALRGEPYDIQHRICVGDTVKWVHERAELEFDQDGVLAAGFGTVQDITERKQAEVALMKSEERFKLLSETAGRLLTTDEPQGIVNELCRQVMEHLDCQAFFNFLVDERAGRLHLNAWAGIPEEEARKMEWLDYGVAVCGCAAQECRCIVAEDIQRTTDPQTDLVRTYGIQAYACHPLMVQGRLIGTLSFGTRSRTRFSREDLVLMKTVTDQVATALERMRLIKELRSSREQLEIRVEERTAELKKMNEEQNIYTSMLEQSNRNLEDFAHVASHDLQEPLRKIQTFGDLLGEMYRDSLDEEGRDYLKRMQRAAGRMQTLVLDLLRYARVNTKAEPFKRFNLKVSVEEAIADLEVLREETGGRIEVGELPNVEADQVQMHQLFQNLIGNGLKYRSACSPIIRVHCDSSTSGPLWVIRVEDNGIGFDESYVPNIFKPFQRLHGKNSPYEGTGMGLAICRRIVERHRGSITARSAPGKGSTFIVKLPKKQVRLEKVR